MEEITPNLLIEILKILGKSEEEQVDVINLYNYYFRARLMNFLGAVIGKEILDDVSTEKDPYKLLTRLSDEVEKKEALDMVLEEFFDYTEKFVEILLKEATKDEAQKVVDFLSEYEKTHLK